MVGIEENRFMCPKCQEIVLSDSQGKAQALLQQNLVENNSERVGINYRDHNCIAVGLATINSDTNLNYQDYD